VAILWGDHIRTLNEIIGDRNLNDASEELAAYYKSGDLKLAEILATKHLEQSKYFDHILTYQKSCEEVP